MSNFRRVSKAEKALLAKAIKQNNADRIRSMTDEELAEYLDGVCHDLWQMFVKDPKKMWLEWLKQECDYENK